MTLFKGTPQEVIGGADYFAFDSTLQSERSFIAQSLQELLVAVIQNPQAAQMLDLDPRSMMNEIQFLRGAGNVSRFSLSKQVASGSASAAAAGDAGTGTSGADLRHEELRHDRGDDEAEEAPGCAGGFHEGTGAFGVYCGAGNGAEAREGDDLELDPLRREDEIEQHKLRGEMRVLQGLVNVFEDALEEVKDRMDELELEDFAGNAPPKGGSTREKERVS